MQGFIGNQLELGEHTHAHNHSYNIYHFDGKEITVPSLSDRKLTHTHSRHFLWGAQA